jgi:regulator of sigma E protease
LLQFAAILSINLGVINALPIPALDGGRIFFLLIEKIRGRSLNDRWETLAHNLGFILLMALVVVVTARDVMRLFQ